MLILDGILWGAAIGLGILSGSIPAAIGIIIVKAAAQAVTKKEK